VIVTCGVVVLAAAVDEREGVDDEVEMEVEVERQLWWR